MSPRAPEPPETVQARTTCEQTVLDLFASMSAKDRIAVAALLDAQIEWTLMLVDSPAAGPHVGLQAVLQLVMDGPSAVFRHGDPQVHVRTIISCGDFVMAETEGRGERIDGRPYRNRYAWAIELSGGRIRKVREYMDTAYAGDFYVLKAGGPGQG